MENWLLMYTSLLFKQKTFIKLLECRSLLKFEKRKLYASVKLITELNAHANLFPNCLSDSCIFFICSFLLFFFFFFVHKYIYFNISYSCHNQEQQVASEYLIETFRKYLNYFTNYYVPFLFLNPYNIVVSIRKSLCQTQWYYFSI